MSKGSKSRNKAARKSKKVAAKNAKKAQYKAWADAGITKKSKRHVLKKARKSLVSDRKHEVTKCTNIGCARCVEQAARTRRIVVGPVSPVSKVQKAA